MFAVRLLARVRPIKYGFMSFHIAALAVAVYIVASAVWPGLYLIDSLQQLRQAMAGVYRDQHPPIMSALWSVLLWATGTPGSMLAFHLSLLAVGLAVWVITFWRMGELAVLPFLALAIYTPTILFLLGVIVKDVGLAVALCAGFAITALITLRRERSVGRFGLFSAVLALGFYATGVRWNALPSVIPLLYLLALSSTCRLGRWTHPAAALIAVFCSGVLLIMNLSLTYLILRPERIHLVQFLQAFDLAGIAVRTGQSKLPQELQTDKFNLLELGKAYNVENVDPLYMPPSYAPKLQTVNLDNVDNIVDNQAIGGNVLKVTHDPAELSKLTAAWLTEIRHHPTEYLYHRLEVFLALLRVGREPYAAVVPGSILSKSGWPGSDTSFKLLNSLVGLADRTPLFTGWFWCLILTAATAVGFLIMSNPLGKVVIALGISGLSYASTYFFLAMSSDFRYLYWTVVSGTLTVVILSGVTMRYCRNALTRAWCPVRGPRASPVSTDSRRNPRVGSKVLN